MMINLRIFQKWIQFLVHNKTLEIIQKSKRNFTNILGVYIIIIIIIISRRAESTDLRASFSIYVPVDPYTRKVF